MKQHKEEMIFGVRAVLEALEAGKELEKVLLKNSAARSDIFRELKQKLRERNVPYQAVPPEKLNAVTRKNHQGVIAYLSEITYADIETIIPSVFESGKQPLVLVLDQVTDVRNFGAIARTAECAGVDAIVIPNRGSARITGEAVKTSAGALHIVPVCRHPDLKSLLKFLKLSGLTVFAASEKAAGTVYEADLDVPAAIIMGSEDTGISQGLLEDTDTQFSIPLAGTISSLNVSVATGIILFEAIRQRSKA